MEGCRISSLISSKEGSKVSSRGIAAVFCAMGIAASPCQPHCLATLQFTFLERGIHVNGTSDIGTLTGGYQRQRTITDEFGTAAASIDSSVQADRIQFSAIASEHATELDVSFKPRAKATLTAEFVLSDSRWFEFSAIGGGVSDSEHWQSFLTLSGPDILWNDRWNSVGISSGQVSRLGVLEPGDYQLSVQTFPIVFGGLDGGWAESWVDMDLRINPLPEPTQLLWYGWLAAMLWRRTWQRR